MASARANGIIYFAKNKESIPSEEEIKMDNNMYITFGNRWTLANTSKINTFEAIPFSQNVHGKMAIHICPEGG